MTHLLRFYNEFPRGVEDTMAGALYIGELASLAESKEDHQAYHLGSTMTLSSMIEDLQLARYAPAVWDAARVTSTPQIRNTRTLGGELAWGSYHSPLIASLLAYDARLKIRRPAAEGMPAKEEAVELSDFYEDELERDNSQGRQLICRQANLATRDLILKVCIPSKTYQSQGSFSFVRILTPKISTENSGVVVAVRGLAQGGSLVKAQFVASGQWMSSVKDEIPLEGTSLKPAVFFEKLYQFCERYPFGHYRRQGPSEGQLGQIVFGLMKEGFSQYLGV